jgi:hypothetical protein
VKRSRIEAVAENGLGFDTETWRIEAGIAAPRLVLGAMSWFDADVYRARQRAREMLAAGHNDNAARLLAEIGTSPDFPGKLLDRRGVLELFAQVIEDSDTILTTANAPFDLLVCLVALAEEIGDFDRAMTLVFRMLEDQRVLDVQTLEALHAVAQGHLNKDPRTGGPLINPDTGKRGRYALAMVLDLVLNLKNAKVNDEYRERYREFDGVPLHLLPEVARIYPVDDTRNTHMSALAQTGHIPKAATQHEWSGRGGCSICGATSFGEPCWRREVHRNYHDLGNQVYTHWAMYLGAAEGFAVAQDKVQVIEDQARAGGDEAMVPHVKLGFLRANGKQDLGATKKAVAIAYGARDACPVCRGTGKVPSPKAPLIGCPACKDAVARAKKSGVDPATLPTCIVCRGARKIPNPKTLINCAQFEYPVGADGQPIADAEPSKIKTCDGTGLMLPTEVPRAEKDGVQYGRDVLNESGNEALMALADYQEDAKILNVYVPWLRRARRPIAGHFETCPQHKDSREDCTCPGPYEDIPLTLWPNVLLETGRTSYGGVVQLLPRAPGRKIKIKQPDGTETERYIPSLRETIVSRPHSTFSTTDYEGGELITHGQSCIYIVGKSALARALLANVKPHNALAATMMGITIEEFERRLEHGTDQQKRECKAARQAAKPPNFGYPGGMGPVKLVQTQRRQGPDTPHPSGPRDVDDGNGNMVRGYKGLRFCILMDGAERCGATMLYEWNRRPIAPTCEHCIECAVRLKEIWLRQWPENEDYFEFINDVVEHGMLIKPQTLQRWPHLRDVFEPNTRLAPGEIMQHVSGRVRGGVDYCAAANGFFQGLLADAAKHALRIIARECYDVSVRVSDMLFDNSLCSAYAGGTSPLLRSKPILFAHDEVIIEHPDSVAHDGAMRAGEIMVSTLRHYCPHLADACRAEPALMKAWYKNATAVWARGGKKRADAADRLVPWEPKV